MRTPVRGVTEKKKGPLPLRGPRCDKGLMMLLVGRKCRGPGKANVRSGPRSGTPWTVGFRSSITASPPPPPTSPTATASSARYLIRWSPLVTSRTPGIHGDPRYSSNAQGMAHERTCDSHVLACFGFEGDEQSAFLHGADRGGPRRDRHRRELAVPSPRLLQRMSSPRQYAPRRPACR
jgi:hypothetical protein